jgi:aromatase
MTNAQVAAHTAEFNAPPERGYQLITDVTLWPVLFGPCIAARVLEKSAASERVRLWALAGAEVLSWTSWRGFDAQALRVDFRQEEPSPTVAAMSGRWEFTSSPDGPDQARLVLHHQWATYGSPQQAAVIAAALDRNSTAEISAVRAWAEQPAALGELAFSFSDRVFIPGDRALAMAYDFLYRADLWPERLPHVSRVDLQTAAEPVGGGWVQTMDMLTTAGDGSTHGTRSVRMCFPSDRIVYKQTTTPRGLLGHSGEWAISAAPGGACVTATHTVALDLSAIDVFGNAATLAEARRLVRERLGANSRQTMDSARRFSEGAASGQGGTR